MRYILLVFVLSSLAVSKNEVEAAKILGIFPMPSKSHWILVNPLFKELAHRGHQVTMISPFKFDEPIANYSEVHMEHLKKDESGIKFWADPNVSGFTKLNMLVHAIPKYLAELHDEKNLREFLDKNEKFDVCIYLVGMVDSFLGVCDHVNATPIGFNTVGMNVFLGHMTYNPTPYSYVPNIYLPFSDKMSFFQRVGNTIAWTGFELLLTFINHPIQQEILSKFYPNAPPLEKLIDNVDLHLTNTNYATDTLIPLLPNIIPIGGFHLQEKLELPKDLQTYLDNSKKGVIYFNLGSNAKSKFLEKDTLQSFLKTFSKLDYDILWKFEEELPGKPANVRLENWLPQRAILTHPNVKIFITHGGLGGTVEAIYGGVPMVCIPLYGDQSKNCAGSAGNGYAVVLDMVNLNEEKLTTAINEVLNNKLYKEKVMMKSDVYKNQPVKPMDRAVFWVDHVIRHKGAKHLKAQAANIAWYKHMLLDVFAFLTFVSVLTLTIIYFICKLLLKLSCKLFSRVCKCNKSSVLIKKKTQ